MKIIILASATLLLVTSCSIYNKFEAPVVDTAALCGPEVQLQEEAPEVASWRPLFTDPLLADLIDTALVRNADLQIAQLNIDQAAASLRAAKLAYLPSLFFSPEGTLNWNKDMGSLSIYNLPATMQWELDIFGRLHNSKEQARAVVLQSKAYRQMVQTQLIATLANSYYTLVMLDEQLRIAELSTHNQQENLEVIRAMKEVGMQNEAAVNQAEASYYSVQSTLEDLKRQRNAVANSVALLLHRAPHEIARTQVVNAQPLQIDHTRPISLTALAARPDVRSAEYALRGSFYNVNVARSAFYPSLTVGGNAGWSNNLGFSITNPGSLILTAVGSLTQPLFNRGANLANLAIAKSRYEQQLLTFEKALLTAGSEVNDALYACQTSETKLALRQKQVAASEAAYTHSRELMNHSSTTYLEVLYAQSAQLQAELQYAADWLEGVQSKINLYKALGGGQY